MISETIVFPEDIWGGAGGSVLWLLSGKLFLFTAHIIMFKICRSPGVVILNRAVLPPWGRFINYKFVGVFLLTLIDPKALDAR